MKNTYKEEHHCVPISCSGVNWKENCITLTNIEHKQLHEVLDIPYGLLRRYRKRTNHLLYMDTYYVSELMKLHKLYFARLAMLSEQLIIKHARAMRSLYQRACDEYRFVPNGVKYETNEKYVDQFYKYLDLYHAILMHHAVEMEKRLKDYLPQKHPTE